MFSVLAIVIALACIAASAERLKRAVLVTSIDPAPIADALRGEAGAARVADLRAALKEEPEGTWERELAEAFDGPPAQRDATVNELLGELDFRLQSWSRVPRTCARVAALSGLVLGALALRQGLSVADDLPYEVKELAIGQAVGSAISAVAVGICGAIFCIVLGGRATKAAKVRQEDVDRLVERLEAISPRPSAENQK